MKPAGRLQVFFVCDATGTGITPCTFTESSMQKLWKRSGGDIARCVRHGALICNEVWRETKQEAQKWARGEAVSRL